VAGEAATGADGGESSPRGLRRGGAVVELPAWLEDLSLHAAAELPHSGAARLDSRGGGARGSRPRSSGLAAGTGHRRSGAPVLLCHEREEMASAVLRSREG